MAEAVAPSPCRWQGRRGRVPCLDQGRAPRRASPLAQLRPLGSARERTEERRAPFLGDGHLERLAVSDRQGRDRRVVPSRCSFSRSSGFADRTDAALTWPRSSLHAAGEPRHANTSETQTACAACPALLSVPAYAHGDVAVALAQLAIPQDQAQDAERTQRKRDTDQRQECPDDRARYYQHRVNRYGALLRSALKNETAGRGAVRRDWIRMEEKQRADRR